ncbi:MAG: glycoside hydrolase family 3 C-terminal domain-containing protein, partial [Anaerolineales bacterium]|nr:glycoside hydrolase family 3 C-terminal domain-containing protein [Anaerolineales bacterium]
MDQVKDILNQLTLEEKTSLCSGRDMWHTKEIERLGVPSIMLADGPHGLRKQPHPDDPLGESVPATCFPTASALAASWDRTLVQEVGAALGEEALQEGVSVILGPGCNIKRSPMCGRNFEYFSEDPYLSGEMAKSHIRGVQSKGIGTALKHFAANNQERRRMSINAVIDERALHEIYLRGFEIAVRGAQPWAVMSAYNQINGTFCSENADLLSDLLKRKWGHEGIVLTDWGAMNQRVKAMLSGCELEMPGLDNGNDALLTAAIREGRLDESNLDGAVERLLTLIFRAQENRRPGFAYDPEAHHALARRAAAEGAVLLKNSGGLLPLRRDTRVAVAGRFAKEPRFQGAGSSYINPSLLDHAYDEMEKLAAPNSLGYAPGYTAHADLPEADLICKAMRLARDAEVAVVFAGLP